MKRHSYKLKLVDVALRIQGIQINDELLSKIIKTVDLVNKKGGNTNLKDITKMK